MSNLTTRVLVAVIGIPVIVFLTITGGWPFFLLVTLISLLGLREFYAMARERGTFPQTGTGLLFGVGVNVAFFHHELQEAAHAAAARLGTGLPFPSLPQSLMIIFLLFIPAVLLTELFRARPHPARNIATTVFGVCYIPLLLGSLVGLRELFVPSDFPVLLHFDVRGTAIPPEIVGTIYRWGGNTVLSLFAAVWVCDSAAYFVGTAMGRHPLLPRVSPKKTWEGAVAGFVAAVLAFLIARALALPYMSLGTAVVCGVMVGVFGQLGDFAESLMKRDTGVKDSSAIIPGHGGVLDRFDSLIVASPLVYLYLDFVVF